MASNLAAFQRRIQLRAGQMTDEAFRKHHAAVARKELGEEQARQVARRRVAAPYVRHIDGREGVPEESVKLYGVIEYTFSLASDVAAEIYAMILRASPVGPAEGGHYRDDHIILVDGTQVPDLGSVSAAAEVTITNLRPYARKIEGGAKERFRRRLTNRRPGLSVQAPNGVYEITAHAARRQFGNVAEIEFGYRAFIGGDAPGPRGGLAGNRSANRFPSITIRPR